MGEQFLAGAALPEDEGRDVAVRGDLAEFDGLLQAGGLADDAGERIDRLGPHAVGGKPLRLAGLMEEEDHALVVGDGRCGQHALQRSAVRQIEKALPVPDVLAGLDHHQQGLGAPQHIIDVAQGSRRRRDVEHAPAGAVGGLDPPVLVQDDDPGVHLFQDGLLVAQQVMQMVLVTDVLGSHQDHARGMQMIELQRQGDGQHPQHAPLAAKDGRRDAAQVFFLPDEMLCSEQLHHTLFAQAQGRAGGPLVFFPHQHPQGKQGRRRAALRPHMLVQQHPVAAGEQDDGGGTAQDGVQVFDDGDGTGQQFPVLLHGMGQGALLEACPFFGQFRPQKRKTAFPRLQDKRTHPAFRRSLIPCQECLLCLDDILPVRRITIIDSFPHKDLAQG